MSTEVVDKKIASATAQYREDLYTQVKTAVVCNAEPVNSNWSDAYVEDSMLVANEPITGINHHLRISIITARAGWIFLTPYTPAVGNAQQASFFPILLRLLAA